VRVSDVLDAETLDSLRIAPTPALDHVTIDLPTAADYTLTSVTGEALQKGHLESGANVLRLDTFPAGVYLLHITGFPPKRIVIVR
jgi:hypothetical protein